MDRINEVYYRQLYTEKTQDDLRERVHWMCENTKGKTVLDIGCSQGITPILLGREGFEVTGVDLNPDAIEYANEQLKSENEAVQKRVQFLCADIKEVSFDQEFDTVLVGEMLEHVFNQGRVLRHIRSFLKEDGRIVITVPFGYHPDLDHKKTFFFSDLIRIFEEGSVFVEYMGVVGNRIAVIASNSTEPQNIDMNDLLLKTEQQINQIMIENDQEIKRLKKRTYEKNNVIKELEKKVKDDLSDLKTLVSKKTEESTTYQSQRIESLWKEVVKDNAEKDRLLSQLKSDIEKMNEMYASDKYNAKSIGKDQSRVNHSYRTLVQAHNAAVQEIKDLEDRVVDLRNTVRYRIGDEMVSSLMKPGLRTLKLPVSIIKLLKEGYRNTSLRKQRYKNHGTPVNKETPLPSGNQLNLHANYTQQNMKKKISQFIQHTHSKCNRPDVKVACILDEFSYECFRYECSLEQLKIDTWQEQLEEMNPEFLFVESAWHGVNKSWLFQLTDLQKKSRSKFKDLVQYCKENGILTVFWNKEDPPNFDKFIAAAKMFDVIFTSDENCISKYKEHVEHDQIYALPFAAQPAIHNPVNADYRHKENVAFAGSWYAERHEERQQDMRSILAPATDYDLHIYDRFFDFKDNDRYRFPDEYQSHIIGALDYQNMLKAYKMYKVFLNVNSVKDSSTMFSRRVYELLASGTNVISTYSKGIQELFKDIVASCDSEEAAKTHLQVLLNNEEYSQRLSVLGVREVYSRHLYKHRFQFILEQIGIKNKPLPSGKVSIVTCTNRPKFINQVFDNYSRQEWEDKELIIVLNSNDMDIESWKSKAKSYPNVSIYRLPDEVTLGECLNFAINKSKYEYIAKFDDDDYYGPYFLTDYMHAFEYTGADLVGKCSFHTYIESMKVLAVRSPHLENKFMNFVHGGTMVFKREVWEATQFPDQNSGEDTYFLRACTENGFKIYSTNRYNFTYMRRSNATHHTWKIEDYEFLRKCSIVAYTDDYESHVTV